MINHAKLFDDQYQAILTKLNNSQMSGRSGVPNLFSS